MATFGNAGAKFSYPISAAPPPFSGRGIDLCEDGDPICSDGNSVPAHRERLGWSQRIADELGVSRQTIISIEKERFDPSLHLAFRIAHAFDLSIEEIFTPDDPE